MTKTDAKAFLDNGSDNIWLVATISSCGMGIDMKAGGANSVVLVAALLMLTKQLSDTAVRITRSEKDVEAFRSEVLDYIDACEAQLTPNTQHANC